VEVCGARRRNQDILIDHAATELFLVYEVDSKCRRNYVAEESILEEAVSKAREIATSKCIPFWGSETFDAADISSREADLIRRRMRMFS